ncbi:uncharacterized protein F4822DRAFT_84758 [Hypoxylon trugodes]|uniref:uncharacterized protein n=1 Tax=Hypoxylon trugodes TaxID=326681 RepID=UPI00219B9897|nr:uncharacterized protein F4822DRAFT_84758 [Hypoxylon trugodes]KAI1383676.1 hypothetical protein F4822DRAFT_84758 [Hypoxylon trugodes]
MKVVRKHLKEKGETEMFKRETTCLRLLNQLQHPNIIRLWGSYTYRDEQNFLFPCADMDLGSFLIAKDRYQDFQWDFTFYSALTGLASALSNTHRLLLNENKHGVDLDAVGYHHDLRPPNVLVNADTFILADFGLGRLKPVGDSSHTPYKWISGDYVAPENTDSQENPQAANRATDVWAFGCLMAEVITYMLTGAEGVEVFREKRLTPGRLPRWKESCFYQPHGEVKQEVVDWMGGLEHDNPHPDIVPLIDLAFQTLRADPQDRPNMDAIHRELQVLNLKKHFCSVQDIFHKICATDENTEPLIKRHLESLRYAQSRFEVWGNALTSSEDVSLYDDEKSKSSVVRMKKLFQALRKERERQHLKDRPVLFSLENLISSQSHIVQAVEDLLGLTPNSLIHLAGNQYKKEVSDCGLPRQLQNSHHTIGNNLAVAGRPNSVNSLLYEFKEEARRFWDGLSDDVPLNEILKVTSIDNVYDITDKIQDEQREHGGLRDLSKLKIYLERLEGYVDTINDIIDGSTEILALIWGPVAILLQLARPLDRAYDSVINAIAEIGRALPDFQVSASILNQTVEAKEILVFFFKDLLGFYCAALEFLSHPNWMHAFDRLWPEQQAYYSEIASHIGRLIRLMRTKICIGDIQQEYEFRKKALESFKEQKKASRKGEFYRIMTFFAPPRYDHTLNNLHSLRYRGDGHWLFVDKTFVQWRKDSQDAARVLWLKGIPGAGKTVLSGAVIDHLSYVKRTKIAFAFLTYQQAETSALSTIHSLVFQLADGDENLMAMVCESMNKDLRANFAGVGNLLSSLINYTVGDVYIVIDGVDETSQNERYILVEELLRLTGVCKKLRVILSARPEADLTQVLEEKSVTIQIHDHNEGSIQSYVRKRMGYIFDRRRVLPHAKTNIESLLRPLANRAKGMFLYARLVLDMVDNIYDMSELQEELRVLPENLDAAYRRIIERLGRHADIRMTENARRLLGWIACSSVLITVEEAHQALVVRPDHRDQVFYMVAKLDVIELLGPIVEIVDNNIRFVHFTAKEYVSSPHLGAQLASKTQATLDLAMQCIGYLCQRHHNPDLSSKECLEKVTTGQYSFHAFATRMWFDLVRQYFQLTKAENPSPEIIKSLRMLWECRKKQDLHSIPGDEGDAEREYEGNSEAIFETLRRQEPFLYRVLNSLSQFRDSSFLFTGRETKDSNKGREDPFSMSKMSRKISEALDQALCDSPDGSLIPGNPVCHPDCANILLHYGPRPFKCKFPGCEFWRHGFKIRGLRNKHERSHDTPLKCHIAGCGVDFLSDSMRREHLKQAHRDDSERVSFDARNLARGGVETMLLDLVQENNVEAVRGILTKFPDALEDRATRNKLRLVGAFAASADMLKLLEGPVGCNMAKGAFEKYIQESIRGRNGSTLSYLFPQAIPFDTLDSTYTVKNPESNLYKIVSIVSRLVSSNWFEGMRIWSRQIRSGLDRIPETRKSSIVKQLFGHERIFLAASSHLTAEQQLFCLWRDSGLAPLLGRDWATSTLRVMVEHYPSIPLAQYLLELGADINYRSSRTRKTALHLAAKKKSTAKGAEMIRFILLNGADPEADQEGTSGASGHARPGKKIREEKGAKDIYKHLGKTWDELVKETRSIRNEKKECKGASVQD